jgi:glycosyltransferase involved in cell wall biosynthesis
LSTPLRVGIEAQLVPAISGGVQQTVIGLASALSALPDGDEQYVFFTQAGGGDWLRPYLGDRCSLVEHPPTPVRPRPRWRRAAGALAPRPALRALDRLREGSLAAMLPATVPWSDGTAERAGVHLVHFALQNGYRTRLPSIYVPHDLQHVHLPGLFRPTERKHRDVSYRQFCADARAVVALTRWGKQDLVRSFGLRPDGIFVVGWPSVLDHYPAPSDADLEAVRARLGVADAFALYPAQTFAHKNHRTLIDAIAILRDQHALRVNLVCTGHRTERCGHLIRHARALGLSEQVRFLGFVEPLELASLYRLARLLVFPSLFEGYGMPVREAFAVGLPVACSNASCLPEVSAYAAVLFDPSRPEKIAEAVRRAWTDDELRAALVERGHAHVRRSSWQGAARIYRALFRHAAGRATTDADRALLDGAR